MQIAVALSGGVDSSVAALVLKKAGHEVEGITMSIYREGTIDSEVEGNACYGPEEKDDIEAAKAFCEEIDIPYHVFDCADEYEKVVLDYFKQEYLKGRTPNPCVRCNHQVKLGFLPEVAKSSGLDFEKIATGHYANIATDPDSGRLYLKKAADEKKDQSYFLYRLSQSQLAKLIFPLGGLKKTEVRKIASDNKLISADYTESQDFIAGDYKELFKGLEANGDITDKSGNVLGCHNGLWNYTIGQRRGLGISSETPLYVTRLDERLNRVVVGLKEELIVNNFSVSDTAWMKLTGDTKQFDASVKIRSSQKGVPAEVLVTENGTKLTVSVLTAINAVTPGQSAVFYDDEGAILCGGIID